MGNLHSDIESKKAVVKQGSEAKTTDFELGTMSNLMATQKAKKSKTALIKDLRPIKTRVTAEVQREGAAPVDKVRTKAISQNARSGAGGTAPEAEPILLKKFVTKTQKEPMRDSAPRAVKEVSAPVEAKKQAAEDLIKETSSTHIKKSAPAIESATEKKPSKASKQSVKDSSNEAKSTPPAKSVEAKPAKQARPAREATQAAPAEQAASGPSCDLNAAQKTSYSTLIFYTLLSLILFAGWFYSSEEIITAKEGIGYDIGIIGGAMMLLLIIYPLRKTAKFMRGMGAIKHWFRVHMIFGLIGPVLIIFHANFEVGSLNSSVALGAMILVALSGLVGRHIYAGIHYGLYGKEMNLKALKEDFEHKITVMKYILDYAPALQERIKNFDEKALKPRYSFIGSLLGLIRTSLGAMRLRLSLTLGLRRTLRVAARRNEWSAAELKSHGRATREYIAGHIKAAKSISSFKVYERLFSLWHILHMPLFLMLVLTAIIHVIAVHMF